MSLKRTHEIPTDTPGLAPVQVIGFAAALEEAIAHPDHALPLDGRAALAVGLGLFVAGTALAKWRAVGTLPLARTGLIAAMAVGILGLSSVPSWASLAIGLVGIAAVVVVEHRALARIAAKEAPGEAG